MTPEGRVKAAIKRWLAAQGWWYCMPATGGYGASGVPDIVGCRPVVVGPEHIGQVMGAFFAIEAKAPGKRRNTTELQDRQIAAIHQAGGGAIVVDDVAQLEGSFP